MIDAINPMNFDVTKNLHGHVRVELRDRWTGRVVDSQEKDNLVTNAVQELIAAQAWTQTTNNKQGMSTDVLPLWSKALGGLLLFDGTLTEAATNTRFPSNVKLVGCAGQTSDTTGSIRGSLNTQESVYTSNGFTTTWDFLTSQANGTIASLARTSYRFISHPQIQADVDFSLASDTAKTPTSNIRYLGYDETNKYLYIALNSSSTIDGVTYPSNNIYRVKADFDKVGLLQSLIPPASKWTVVKSLSSSDGTTSAVSFIYDEYNNNFLYIGYNDTTLHVIAIDGTHSTKTLTGTSGSLCVTENYYWRWSSSTIYCIEKTNLTNVQAVAQSYRILIPLKNDVVASIGYYYSLTGSYAPVEYWYPDGTSITVSADTYGDSNKRWNVGKFYTTGPRLHIPASYLGTIANLDSPVTKTSSQTMKITYTLTEA